MLRNDQRFEQRAADTRGNIANTRGCECASQLNMELQARSAARQRRHVGTLNESPDPVDPAAIASKGRVTPRRELIPGSISNKRKDRVMALGSFEVSNQMRQRIFRSLARPPL